MLRTVRILRGTPCFRFGRRAVVAIPHPEKAHRGGEDAFISDDFVVGVADGVGGYASSGVNPAVFTRQIMQFTWAAVKQQQEKALAPQGGANNTVNSGLLGQLTAQAALEIGLRDTMKQRTVGGCPVTLATMLDSASSGGKQDGTASILNLGDCGTVVLRGDHVMYRTTVQQHYFNCPFQLPSDAPSSGMRASVALQPGDVVLQASDGLFDNVPDGMVQDTLLAICRGTMETLEGANHLAAKAAAYGKDPKHVSPFALSAREIGHHNYTGGKLDDVTVLITVVEETKAPRRQQQQGVHLITDLFP